MPAPGLGDHLVEHLGGRTAAQGQARSARPQRSCPGAARLPVQPPALGAAIRPGAGRPRRRGCRAARHCPAPRRRLGQGGRFRAQVLSGTTGHRCGSDRHATEQKLSLDHLRRTEVKGSKRPGKCHLLLTRDEGNTCSYRVSRVIGYDCMRCHRLQERERPPCSNSFSTTSAAPRPRRSGWWGPASFCRAYGWFHYRRRDALRLYRRRAVPRPRPRSAT